MERKTTKNARQPKVDRKVVRGNTVQHGKGIVMGNPKRCVFCLKPIRALDNWLKQTALPDPETMTTYSIIMHDRCNMGKG